MSLSSLVKTGPTREPLRILLHGVEGIGKTTFASKAPGAIFLSPEDGGGDLDFARLTIDSWKQARARVQMLLDESHDYRVLVIDTIDFLERLCWQFLIGEANATGIEQVGGGYGKGYTAATEEQVRFIALLDTLRERRRMHVIALAHTEIKTFNDPEGANYDRYQIRMHKGAAGLWSGWSDCILFANYDIAVKTEKGSGDAVALKKGKASTRAPDRMLYTERRAQFDAKNRYSLPAELPLSWDEFATAIRWTERDAAIRSKPAPPAPPPTVEQIRAAMIYAKRELDWVDEDIGQLLETYSVRKVVDLPEHARAAVIAALTISHRKE